MSHIGPSSGDDSDRHILSAVKAKIEASGTLGGAQSGRSTLQQGWELLKTFDKQNQEPNHTIAAEPDAYASAAGDEDYDNGGSAADEDGYA